MVAEPVANILRHLDPIERWLDRVTGRQSRRDQRWEEESDAVAFAHELGRAVTPVAHRCGWEQPQLGGTVATYCGAPSDLRAAQPWLADDLPDEDHACVDMHVSWRDGWVELTAEGYVRGQLLASATDRRQLPAAMDDVAGRLTSALEQQRPIDGTSPWDDPRDPDGSWQPLRLED